jgi:hypothetical protein
MSEISSVTDFTDSKNSTPILAERKLKLDIRLNNRRNIDRIAIITDRKLKNNQIDLLLKWYSVYEIKKDDIHKPIRNLPRCDIYIFSLINNLCRSEDWGSIYYSRSKHWLKQNGYSIVYYRTLELITDQALGQDFTITEFPNQALSKYDLANELLYNTIPRHVGLCGILLQCCCSRITMADCCSLICGISVGL